MSIGEPGSKTADIAKGTGRNRERDIGSKHAGEHAADDDAAAGLDELLKIFFCNCCRLYSLLP